MAQRPSPPSSSHRGSRKWSHQWALKLRIRPSHNAPGAWTSLPMNLYMSTCLVRMSNWSRRALLNKKASPLSHLTGDLMLACRALGRTLIANDARVAPLKVLTWHIVFATRLSLLIYSSYSCFKNGATMTHKSVKRLLELRVQFASIKSSSYIRLWLNRNSSTGAPGLEEHQQLTSPAT